MLNSKVLTQEEIIKREYELLKKSLDNTYNTNLSFFQRETKTFIEYDFNMPQTLFYIDVGNNSIIVGRKTLSQHYLDQKLQSLNCSRITPNMFLGFLADVQFENRMIVIKYHPLTQFEKHILFQKVVESKNKYDIEYPFRFRYFGTNLEQTSDNLNWKVDNKAAEALSTGEKHFREYSRKIILEYGLSPKIIYDPACSTGEFLHSIKLLLPNSLTIGHDMSPDMVDYSKDKVDLSLCCDANNSPIENESVNLLVLRFLNGGVVTSSAAKKLLEVLQQKIKKGGLAICFGHTPVLVGLKDFENVGLELIGKIGYEESSNSIFQYYLSRRKR